nr:MAG TPA: hypothetical protein [Caudoviricetes sp.]
MGSLNQRLLFLPLAPPALIIYDKCTNCQAYSYTIFLIKI